MRQMIYTLNGRGSHNYMGNVRMGILPAFVIALVDQYGPAVLNAVGHFLGVGPSYDSANGGEVMRQLTSVNVGKPWANSYCEWLKEYAPDIWQSGNVWAPGPANASTWHDKYVEWIVAGFPEGILFDGSMQPKNLAAAVEQAKKAVERQRPPGGGGGGGGGATPGGGGGGLVDDGRGTDGPPPPAKDEGMSTGVKIGLALVAAKVLKLF